MTVLNKAVPLTASANSAPTLTGDDATGTDKVYYVTWDGPLAPILSWPNPSSGREQTIGIRLKSAGSAAAYTRPSGVRSSNGVFPSLSNAAGAVNRLYYKTLDGVDVEEFAEGLNEIAASMTISPITGTYYPGSSVPVLGTFVGNPPTSIDYAVDGGPWAAANATISNGMSSFALPAPAAGNHTLQVRNDGSQSEVSAPIAFAIAAPSAPSNPVIGISVGSGQNTINMEASINGSPVTGFQVFRGTTAGGESTTPIATVTQGITNLSTMAFASFVDSTAANGTPYFYTFKAVNGAGTQASPSAEVTGTPNATSPAHFLNLPTSGQSGYGAAATTPGTAANDAVNGFLDVHYFLAPGAASYAHAVNFVGKYSYDTGGNAANSSWHINLGGGYFGIELYDSTSTFCSAYAQPPSAWAAGSPIWLRFIMNQTGGAVTDQYGTSIPANATYMQYSASLNRPTTAAGWTSFGTAKSGSAKGFKQIGTVQNMTVGAYSVSTNPTSPLTGKLFAAYVTDQLGNSLIELDFTGQTTGATSVAEQPPGTQTWANGSGATVV